MRRIGFLICLSLLWLQLAHPLAHESDHRANDGDTECVLCLMDIATESPRLIPPPAHSFELVEQLALLPQLSKPLLSPSERGPPA